MHWNDNDLYAEQNDGDEAKPAVHREHVLDRRIGTVVVVERSFEPHARKHQRRCLDDAVHDLQRKLRTTAEEAIDQHSWSLMHRQSQSKVK